MFFLLESLVSNDNSFCPRHKDNSFSLNDFSSYTKHSSWHYAHNVLYNVRSEYLLLCTAYFLMMYLIHHLFLAYNWLFSREYSIFKSLLN